MGNEAGFSMSWIVYLVVLFAMIAGLWKMFEKAGKPGWAAVIPIYNLIVLLQIINKPLWWILLCFIPFVNFIVFIIMSMQVAVCFGKSKGWGIGLLFLLPFIGYPILGFGDATYRTPS